MAWARAALCALVMLLGGCADGDGGGGTAGPRCSDGGCGSCTTSTDCPRGATCVEGTCTVAPALDPDRDCGVGECQSDASIACSRNRDCPQDQACDPQLRICVPLGGRSCDGADDCLLGEACLDGLCQPERPNQVLDAAVEDAELLDEGVPDARPVPDMQAPDASSPDADVPDAELLDVQVPDASMIDMLVPDASSTGPDAEIPDMEIPDAEVPDREVPDAEVPDAAIPDAQIPDVEIPDMEIPDAELPDVLVPDADIPDIAVPDAEIPDMEVPDAEVPDAEVPDVEIPDMEIPDMEIPDFEIPDAEIPDEGVPDFSVPDAFVEQPTPPPGAYVYDRLPVGGLDELHQIAFHPQGEYAITLERNDRLFVVDWATGQATPVALGGGLRLRDVNFTRDGRGALIVGAVDDAPAGVVFWFDHLLWQAGLPAVSEVGRLPGITFEAVEMPPWADDNWAHPVILGRGGNSGARTAFLWSFDPFGGPEGLGEFVGQAPAQFSGTGCDDIAFAPDEFGGTGVFVACGENGAETLFYAVIGGVGEWRVNPGNNNLGNTSRVARWPGGDYALVVSWSGRAVYRFEGGQLNAYGDAPRFSRQGIYGVAFQPNGRRALILGRSGVNPLRGTVIEYRHDLYRCDALVCEMIDVSVPGWEDPPYNADSNTYLYDAAFRPGCDGGFVVGGQTSWQGSTGYLIRFTIAGGDACP
ncbi:MAG: hypothetical protein ACE366_28730 [Bradymonadia bacterium]